VQETVKNETFEVELFSPEGGATLGNLNRMKVTISADESMLIQSFLSIKNLHGQFTFNLPKYRFPNGTQQSDRTSCRQC
jgi:hypothetical protein